MKSVRHTIIVIVLLLLISSTLCAQTNDTVIIRRYTQKDGLSSYNIRRIIEDKWGFMWIATQEGISRFDGKFFSNYTKNNFPGNRIGGTDVRELIEDTVRNLIWALPTEGMINAINSISGKVTKNIRIPSFGKDDYSLCMLKTSDELWIGTSTGVRVFNISKNSFEPDLSIPSPQNNPIALAVRSMQKDENGNTWVCYGGYGIVIYHSASKAIIRSIPLAQLNDKKKMSEIRIYKALKLKGSEMLLATSQGLRKIFYERFYRITLDNSPCNAFPVLNEENIDWISYDGENSLLISGYNNLYKFNYALDSHRMIIEMSRANETNWLSSVLCIYKDRKGNTWLGCQEGLGFIRKGRSPFIPYNYDDLSNLKLEHVFAVSPIGNGNILVGLRNGLVEINNRDGKFKKYDTGHLYQHIFEDKKGLVHVSRPDGLFIYQNGKITPISKIYSEFSPFAAFSINSHIFINDSMIILGTENNSGILLWNPLRKQIRIIDVNSKAISLSSNVVNNIFMDRHGRIWVLSNNIISILSADLKNKTEISLKDEANNSNHGHFFHMCEANGSYWVASYGSGVLQLDEQFEIQRVFNTQNGLSNDGVYQIYAVPDNHLLVTSNNGLSRIDLATYRITRYYAQDGLHSSAFEEVSGIVKEGQIYAGGVNGFTVIDPGKFSVNTQPPKLYFTTIETQTAKGKIEVSNLLISSATVSNDAVRTTIYFSGLNYSNPERTEYAYRIIGQSNDWIDNRDRNSFPIMGLSPGSYTIELKAANEDGIWSEPIQLHLYFQPKWYQTWWFKVTLFIILATIIYQIYHFRVSQLKREEKIRRRLARDLHDDLGSTINSVNIFTSLAIMEDADNKYLRKIKETTQEAITSIRDVIWILDDKKDTVEQLTERVHQFAYPLCEANLIFFLIDLAPNAKEHALRKEEKRNLYMVLKEAINNSIKYAEPKSITLNIQYENNKLSIIVLDDGNGFDVSTKQDGNGLGNIKMRSAEIGYRYSIQSSSGKGTIISLTKN